MERMEMSSEMNIDPSFALRSLDVAENPCVLISADSRVARVSPFSRALAIALSVRTGGQDRKIKER